MFLLDMFSIGVSFFSSKNDTPLPSAPKSPEVSSCGNTSSPSNTSLNNTRIPLDTLVDDVAAIVLEYADDVNATKSANINAQEIYSKKLLTFLSGHKNLFKKNSIENLQQKKVILFSEVLDLCDERLKRIDRRIYSWSPDFEDNDPDLFTYLKISKSIKEAIDSPSIHAKIDALKTSIPFLDKYAYFSIMLSSSAN